MTCIFAVILAKFGSDPKSKHIGGGMIKEISPWSLNPLWLYILLYRLAIH